MKPLFIPLKREFYDAFQRLEKRTEYRRPGGPWNERTCRPGRPVVLSCGYGKARRMKGIVTWFAVRAVRGLAPRDRRDVRRCYGHIPEVAAIGISLSEPDFMDENKGELS